MKIIELRILPPIAIGRLGSADKPMAAYDLVVDEKKPLDFRRIVPQTTYKVCKKSGKILSSKVPKKVKFKDVKSLRNKNGKIRPVSPFLEVFAVTDDNPDQLVPLTTDLLAQVGLSVKDISWSIDLANIKIFRRTGCDNDKINAQIDGITEHGRIEVKGQCANFLEDKYLPLGHVQFIQPTEKYPQIRLRYTPAGGKVYGSRRVRVEEAGKPPVDDPIICNDDLVIYDANKGDWLNYKEYDKVNPEYTNPAQIFAGYYDDDLEAQVSWGYLDDECDGFAQVSLNLAASGRDDCEQTLVARAHISAGPPAFAPDTLPVRVVSDELEQILLSPEVEGEVPIEEAKEIVRRAFESVRLMNTAVMNGNTVDGRQGVASTMSRQDSNDFNRYFEPIMATSIVDNLALRALHEQVFNGLSTGAAAWFSNAMRRPDKIGDLGNEERRKMPAMMRGADGRALCLTHRQINQVIKAGLDSMFDGRCQPVGSKNGPDAIEKSDLVSQIMYRGNGNPFAVLSRSAISNCFPGLEFDFRNLWRRALVGILLIENNNYVIGTSTEHESLLNCRLVGICGKPTMVATEGPIYPGSGNTSLKTAANPNGVSFMEWSNNMAQLLQHQGEVVTCHFTKEPSKTEVVYTAEQLQTSDDLVAVELEVNQFFANDSAAFSEQIVKPGELTQGLCAPWQNDYRECACYYWSASRPDFVNVVSDENGLSTGDNWMAKKPSGEYILDDRKDSRLLSYDDLFSNWEGSLDFIVKGFDALDSNDKPGGKRGGS